MVRSKPILLGILIAFVLLYGSGFSQERPGGSRPALEEASLRVLVDRFFTAYAKRDLDSFMQFWSAKSPEVESRRKAMEALFAANDTIELMNLSVRDVAIDGEKARVRVVVEMTALDKKTGRPAVGFGKMNRSLHFIREGGEGWKVWHESSSEEELAAVLVEATTAEERARLLAAERDLANAELWRAVSIQGQRQRVQGKFAEAMATHVFGRSIAEQIGDKLGIAVATNDIAIVQASLGDYTLALESFQRSLAIKQELGNKVQIAAAFNNIGIIYRLRGNYNLAMQYYQRAQVLKEAVSDEMMIASGLNNIGNIYFFQGNYTLALEHLQKSLAIKESLGDKGEMVSTVCNIANVYDEQGDHARAMQYYQRALTMAEETGDKLQASNVLHNIGDVFREQDDYARAMQYFQKSLDLREAIGDKAGIAEVLGKIAFLSVKLGDAQKALQLSERASSIARQGGMREILWNARSVAGIGYRSLNQREQARAAFDEAIATIELLRDDVAGGAQQQQSSFESKVSPYQMMVDLLVSQDKNEEALAYAERSKARALLDVLRSGRIQVTKAMTGAEQARERGLDGKLVSLNSQIAREDSRPKPDVSRLAALKTDLQSARLEREAFQTALYAVHPELKIKRGNAEPLRVEEASELLPDENSALLEYVVTDDKTFLFVLSREQTPAGGARKTAGYRPGQGSGPRTPTLNVYTVAVKQKDLAVRAEAFRLQLARRDFRFSKAAIDLYDLLLRPAHAQLENKNLLVIVPDGALWQLPFQALQTAENRYLLEESAISYAPSLTVLREMVKAKRRPIQESRASLNLLAIGNPALGKQTIERLNAANRDEKLDPLPEAEREVRLLGQLYGNERCEIFVGPDAREDRVKSEAGKFRVLHLATHGILDDASPMYSHLVLSQTEGGASEDGLLEAWEMMNLDLNADLVVLSACETARGRVAEGEGVIGMSWALFVAGCPAAVVSQWKVDSAGTTELMLEFHKQLKNGSRIEKGRMSVAKSLREAALKLLHRSEYRHPFYWAGFVVVGAGF